MLPAKKECRLALCWKAAVGGAHKQPSERELNGNDYQLPPVSTLFILLWDLESKRSQTELKD